MRFNHLFLFGFVLFLLNGCDSAEEPTDSFDREAMLENITENIILTRYNTLNTAVLDLKNEIDDFNNELTITALASAQNKLQEARLAWQACSMFAFGPASMETLRASVNIYPVNTTTIQANISSGSYNLDDVSNIDTKGFPALDYLLFGVGTDQQQIVDFYALGGDTLAKRNYLSDVVQHMATKVDKVNTDWGTYKNQFKQQSGLDVGSALGMLINEMNFDYEKHLRDAKIGIPVGIRSLGNPQPEKTEAYYSGQSLPLAIEALEQLKTFYMGGNGLGLDDYLVSLDAQRNGEPLNTEIIDQFNTAISGLTGLGNPLSTTVVNNSSQANAAYDELQKLIVLLKVDLSSSIGVLITYNSNDGD